MLRFLIKTLGDRSTDDFSLTLAFNPNDNLSAKLRFHTWKDDDGPDAATALGLSQWLH